MARHKGADRHKAANRPGSRSHVGQPVRRSTHRKPSNGADAERERILATDRDGAPWRRWAPMLDDVRRGALPGISGVADETRGISLAFELTPETRAADDRTVCSMVATPTASYLESTVRIMTGTLVASR